MKHKRYRCGVVAVPPPLGLFLRPGLGVAGEDFLVQGLRVVFHQGGCVGQAPLLLGRGARDGSFRQGADG